MTTPPAAPRASSPLFAHLIPSLILAVVATVLFWWNPFGQPPQWATFHLLLKSDVAGDTLLQRDVDGTGMRKDVLVMPVEAGNDFNELQFRIPAGKLTSFILTVLDRPAEAEIQRCWITTQSGEEAAILSPESIQQLLQNAGATLHDGAVRFRTQTGDTLNRLKYSPSPPIDLTTELPPPFWQISTVFAGTLLGCVLLSTFLAGHRAGLARAFAGAGAWSEVHPLRSILIAALLSVGLCAFPVIFAGKSYVSPNNGMPLLYEKFPTVPNSPDEKTENPVGSDIGATMYWHFPASMIEHRAIFQDHEFPLWSRDNWCGVPFFPQLFTMIGDPLHWLTIVTGGASWAWDMKFIIAKILFAVGIGWLVWRTAGSLPVALLCTLSAPYLGFFAYRFCHAANITVCYAPWLLVPWIEGVRAKTHRQAALWAALLLFAEWCQINSGTAKEPIMLMLFLNTAGVWIVLSSRATWRWRLARLGIFTWANVLFLLLSAPLWLVFLEALGKAWTFYDDPQIFQVQPGLAIGLFDDIFYRQMQPVEFLFSPSANFFVLLGVAWAFIRIRTLILDPYFFAALLATVPAAALVFGIVPPSLAASIPLVRNIYHFDDTFSCILFTTLFIIAGFGLRECLARRDHKEWVGDWVCVLVFVGVLLAADFGFTQATHRVARSFLKPGEVLAKSAFFVDYVMVLVAALVVLPWAIRAALRDRLAGPAWALVAACMFAALHFRHGMYLETKFDLYTMNPKTRVDLRDVRSPAIDALRAAATEPSRVVGLDWVMTPGFNDVLNLETISGPDALLDPAMMQLTGALGIPRTYAWRNIVTTKSYGAGRRALDFLNVRYLLNDPSEPTIPDLRLIGSYDLNLYESDTAWPRAFFTDTIIPFRSVPELAREIESGDGRPFAAVPPELGRKLPVPLKDPAKRIVENAHNYHLTCNTTSFEIDATSPGLAVLMETNAPGDFEASVDGRPVPCLSINLAFRGVFIGQPGRHVVKFAYWPKSLDRALWICAAGLIALLGSIWTWFRALPVAAGTVPAKTEAPTCPTSP